MDIYNINNSSNYIRCQENSWISSLIWQGNIRIWESTYTSKKRVDKLHDADRVTREKLESIADTLRIDYIGKDDESLKKDIDAAIKRDKEYDI